MKQTSRRWPRRSLGPLPRKLALSPVIALAVVLTVTVALGILAFPGTAQAKSYNVSDLHIVATVNPDGSMDIVETRTFNFSGSFSWVIQDLSLAGSSGITDIKVSENGKAYALAESGPGTYSYRQAGNKIEITWRFSATDALRTFVLSYRVKGAVVAHLDVAELYWKFVGDEWEVPSSNVLVELNLPRNSTSLPAPEPSPGKTPGDVRAWGHGPLSGEVRITSPVKVTWTVPRLPARTFLEGRVTFAKELVPQAARTSGRVALRTILAEEEALASKANRARLGNLAVVVVLSPLSLIGCIAAADCLAPLGQRA